MTQIMLVSVIGSLFIFLLIVVVLFLIWRKRQQRNKEFELLLDDIKERQAPRANSLTRRLMDKFKLDQASAQSVSGQLINAEKLFLQQFIEQQLQQKSIENMYDQLCDLLDAYVSVMPGTGGVKENPLENSEANQTPEDSAFAAEVEGEASEAQPTISDDDWESVD